MNQKVIGILGGMSWPSTGDYYRMLNSTINERLGKNHCAEIICISVDFQVIEECQFSGGWDKAGELLGARAKQIEAAGADFLLIASNTMHRLARTITQNISIPLLHIADASAHALLCDGIQRVGLLGTLFTMEHPFYRKALEEHGLQVIVPSGPSRQLINRYTYDELVKGKFTQEAKDAFSGVISELHAAGADAVLLACTEFPILMRGEEPSIKLYDTSVLHCEAAVELALADSKNT